MVAINTAYTGDPDDFCSSDDTITMGLQACTHWDALAHVSYDGPALQRLPGQQRSPPSAAPPGAASTRSPRIVSRAILLDVARALGHDGAPAAAT